MKRNGRIAIAALGALATCGSKHGGKMPTVAPSTTVSSVAADDVCVTHGSIDTSNGHLKIRDAATRAVATTSSGDAALLSFTYLGPTGEVSKLASGDVREQLGLKLRAENGCNLVYVMWRLTPDDEIVVQVKRKPGAKNHKECGTEGYSRVKAEKSAKAPEVAIGSSHTLQAELHESALEVWADGKLVWHGSLPSQADGLVGLAGMRTDNVQLDADLSVSTTSDAAAAPPECKSADDE
jgi:hypothetical protein